MNNNPKIIVDDVQKIKFPFSFERIMYDVVKVAEGYSISKIAKKHYGKWNTSIEDIISNANPKLNNIGSVEVGYELKLPQISRYNLLTQTNVGKIYIYFSSFSNELNALVEANRLNDLGYIITLQNLQWRDRTITRIFIGPFLSSKESKQAIEGLEFKSLGII